jgi:hypothetical protein
VTLTQERLHHEARARLLSARPTFAVPDRPDAMAALLIDRRTSAGVAGAQHVVTVLHRFDTRAWIRGTCAFAFGLSPERASVWRRSFTRTIFLAGNPGNLVGRIAFDHVAEDSVAAWYGPAPADATNGIRRLLKLVGGTAPLPAWPSDTIELPGRTGGVHRDLYVATVGVTLPQALVHLNHLLAEAVLDGLVAPGDRLTLRPIPYLCSAGETFAALRVDVDPTRPDRLQAFAGLTEETS